MTSAVLVVGDVIDDIIVRPHGPVTRGSDTTSTITAVPGGSGANQAVWLAAHDVAVRFVGQVAQADLDRHSRELRAAGVDARLIADPDAPTGTIVIVVDPHDGERTMYTDRGANLGLRTSSLPDGLLDDVGLVHVSGYSLFDEHVREVVLALVDRARRRDIAFAVDPGSSAFLRDVGPRRFLAWIDGAALLFPNLDEGRLLTGERDPDTIAAALLDVAQVVALKLGGDGALVVQRNAEPIHSRAAATDVVDTTGAGDAFCGAMLAAWLRGPLTDDVVQHCVAAGARAAAFPGARPTAGSDRRGDRAASS